MTVGLRDFIERRRDGYRAALARDHGADSAFPDTAVNYAMAKVREDCLRRLLNDFDRAVADGDYDDEARAPADDPHDDVFQVVMPDVLREPFDQWCASRGLRTFTIPVEDDLPTIGVGPK